MTILPSTEMVIELEDEEYLFTAVHLYSPESL